MKIWPSLSILKKIILPREPIAGLEITDASIRLVLLNLDEKTKAITTEESAEQPLASGIIVNGAIKDSIKFDLALLKLKKSLKFKISYIIVSIPSDAVYTKILSFPNRVLGYN